MTSLPEWVGRYKESVALSPDDFKLAEALAIAWEALVPMNAKYGDEASTYILDENEIRARAEDALRRIEELGK